MEKEGIIFRRKLHGPLPFRAVFIITLLLFTLLTSVNFWIVNKNIKPTLMKIAEYESTRIANSVIDDAVDKKITKGGLMEGENLTIIEKDKEGKIVSVDLNPSTVNHILLETTNVVQESLKSITQYEMNQSGLTKGESPDDPDITPIIYYIPLGEATNIPLLANLGPRIPVHFQVLGDVTANIKKEIKPFGINNALIDISITIQVNARVVMPVSTKMISVNNDIPLTLRVIQGDVPNFYNNGGGAVPYVPMNLK